MSKELTRTIPVWVIFPGFLILFWTQENFGRIASYIGKPIYSDRLTSEGKRVSYARMLVEMDVSHELPDTMFIEEEDGKYKEQKLDYEWKPVFCEECFQIEYHNEKCGKALPIRQQKQTNASNDIVEKMGKQQQSQGKEVKHHNKKQWRVKHVAEKIPVQKAQIPEQQREQKDGQVHKELTSEQPPIQKEQIPAQVEKQQISQVHEEQMIEQEMEIQLVQKSRGKQKMKAKETTQQKGADKELVNMLKRNRYSPLTIQEDSSTERVTEGIGLNEKNPL